MFHLGGKIALTSAGGCRPGTNTRRYAFTSFAGHERLNHPAPIMHIASFGTGFEIFEAGLEQTYRDTKIQKCENLIDLHVLLPGAPATFGGGGGDCDEAYCACDTPGGFDCCSEECSTPPEEGGVVCFGCREVTPAFECCSCGWDPSGIGTPHSIRIDLNGYTRTLDLLTLRTESLNASPLNVVLYDEDKEDDPIVSITEIPAQQGRGSSVSRREFCENTGQCVPPEEFRTCFECEECDECEIGPFGGGIPGEENNAVLLITNHKAAEGVTVTVRKGWFQLYTIGNILCNDFELDTSPAPEPAGDWACSVDWYGLNDEFGWRNYVTPGYCAWDEYNCETDVGDCYPEGEHTLLAVEIEGTGPDPTTGAGGWDDNEFIPVTAITQGNSPVEYQAYCYINDYEYTGVTHPLRDGHSGSNLLVKPRKSGSDYSGHIDLFLNPLGLSASEGGPDATDYAGFTTAVKDLTFSFYALTSGFSNYNVPSDSFTSTEFLLHTTGGNLVDTGNGFFALRWTPDTAEYQTIWDGLLGPTGVFPEIEDEGLMWIQRGLAAHLTYDAR